MFGLFKKKEKSETKKPADTQSEEMRAFAAKFHSHVIGTVGTDLTDNSQNQVPGIYALR